jgi:thioesterase domain-containing protein
VHPGAGAIDCYIHLAQYLGSERPFYGFQAPGLEDDQKPYDSIDEMAKLYVRELRTEQPNGPYLIGGYSFGGAVAFEMARLIEEQGQLVSLLAIIDTGPTTFRWAEVDDDDASFLATVLQELLPVDAAKLRPLGPDDQLLYILGLAREKQSNFLASLTLSDARRLRSVVRAHMRAQTAYQARPYRGRVTLFRTLDRDNDIPGESFGWPEFAKGGVVTYTISGTHTEIMSEPYVRDLAGKLSHCLDELD